MAGRPGRPRGHKPLIDVIGQKRRVALIEKQYELAMSGDSAAAKMLMDRMDPTLTRAQLAGDAEQPIALLHAEQVAAEMPSDVLKELDALAERANAERGNALGGNGKSTEH